MTNITPNQNNESLLDKIFSGCETKYGETNPQLPKNDPKATFQKNGKIDWRIHITGHRRVGRSPLKLDTGTCDWICCDVDDYKQLAEHVAQTVFKIDQKTIVFKSRSGGYHVFKWLDEPTIHWKAKKEAKQLEHKLIQSGLVVDVNHTLPASYSINKLDKEKNEWIDLPIDKRKPGYWLNMPYFGLNECVALSVNGKDLSFDQFLVRWKYRNYPLLAAMVGKGQKELTIGGANRHTSLFTAACFIKHYLNDDYKIFEELNNSFAAPLDEDDIQHQWNSRNKEEYTIDYFEERKDSYLNNEINPNTNNTKENIQRTDELFFEKKENIEPQIKLDTPKPEKKLVVNVFNGEKPLTKRDYYMEKYLMKGKLTLLQGMGGAGKSTLICQLASCFATGQSFFGSEIKVTGNALIVFAEEEQNEIDLKLKACESIYGKISENKIHTIGYDQNLKLTIFKKDGSTEKTNQYKQLEAYIKENNIQFIGLDPLISLQLGSFDENSNPQMDSFMKDYLIPLAANNDCCLVAAHHTNKISMLTDNEISDNSLYSGRGASSLGAAARIVIGVANMSKKLWEDEYKTILPDERDRHKYVALVDAKNNYAARSDIPTWIKKKTIQVDCENGVEWVNVFETCNLSELSDKKSALRQEHEKKKALDVIHHISKFFEEEQNHIVSVNSVAKKLTSLDHRLANKEEKTLIQEYSRMIKSVFVQGVEWQGFKFTYSYDNHLKNKHNLTKLRANFDDNHF